MPLFVIDDQKHKEVAAVIANAITRVKENEYAPIASDASDKSVSI